MKQAATRKRVSPKRNGHYVIPLNNGKWAYRWKDPMTGKMREKQCDTRMEAEVAQRNGQRLQEEWGRSHLTAESVADAKLALRLIQERGLKVSLTEAVQFWAERKGTKTISYGLAVSRFLADVKVKKTTLANYRSYTEKTFPEETPLSDITGQDIERAINARWNDRTAFHPYQVLKAFFKWCMNPRQRLLSHNPLEECKVYLKPAIYTRQIWEPEEIETLFESCPRESLLALSLTLGAGLRNPEALTFASDYKAGRPWKLVRESDLKTNEEKFMLLVPAHATKTKTERTVRMEKTPWELVKKYQGQDITNRTFDLYRQAYKATGNTYKDNANRHTYASGAAKLYGDSYAADYCGNSVAILRKHYRNQINGFAPAAYAHAWNTIGKKENL